MEEMKAHDDKHPFLASWWFGTSIPIAIPIPFSVQQFVTFQKKKHGGFLPVFFPEANPAFLDLLPLRIARGAARVWPVRQGT